MKFITYLRIPKKPKELQVEEDVPATRMGETSVLAKGLRLLPCLTS